MNDFQQEWVILHGDIERYERLSLGIKLFGVLLVSLFAIGGFAGGLFVATLIFILWLQDGIWKTFQKRLERRVVFLEQALDNKTETDGMAFQLYSGWESSRQGTIGLIKEYVFNALKPTVAYPHVLLVLLVLFFF